MRYFKYKFSSSFAAATTMFLIIKAPASLSQSYGWKEKAVAARGHACTSLEDELKLAALQSH